MNAASNKKLQPILITVLCLALLFAFYYYVVKPKIDEVKAQEAVNNSLQQEITMTQQQIAMIEQSQQYIASEKNDFEIRKLLPANRDIERLLLNFEEIEYVTGSRINSISFNNYNATVASSALRDPAETATTPEATAASETGGATNSGSLGALIQEVDDQPGDAAPSTEQPVDTNTPPTDNAQSVEGTDAPLTSISASILPPNLKLITFDLSMQAPTKEELLSFVKEVEKLERKIHIDQMNFALGGEEDGFSEIDPSAVNVRLLLTTFYYE